MNKLQIKIYHTLLGIAYGDSLGMPTENLTPNQIKEIFGSVKELLPSLKNAPKNGMVAKHLTAGQVTDDTENSIFVTKMLIDTQGKVNENIFVKYLIDWLDNDPHSKEVTGPSTFAAVNAIKTGVPIKEAGLLGTTNGAAMRIAPIGMLYSYENLSKLVKQVNAICIPTHNTQIAIQGAAVVAATVSYFFRNKFIDWNYLLDLIQETTSLTAKYGNQIPTPDIFKRIKFGVNLAKNADETEFQNELYSFLGTGLETIQMVPAATAMAFRYKGDLRRSVTVSANIGGDTDTLAAILGAICGSYNFNIESSQVNLIENSNHIDFKKIAIDFAGIIRKESNPNAHE